MLNKINIRSKEKNLIVYVVLTIVTLAVYWQVNGYDFINFDDQSYVTENARVQSGLTLDGIRWAFSTKYLGLWNPLVWLSFMFNYQLHGLNAGGYHMTNLILHILSALLLFWLFKRMTGAVWRSAFVAAFFALHPLHVESVAWVAERKDVLSAFFWMLTLCLYVYYVEKPAIKKYLLILCSFVLALMSKPMVVTLPVIMILLDYWPLKRFESQKGNLFLWQVKEKAPFFILSAILVLVTLYNPHQPDLPDTPALKQYSLISRLANAPVAFVTYLIKTFWPYDMAIFYPFPAHIPLRQVIGASLLILTITAFVIVMSKHLPCLFAGWFWFAITIAPVIGIIQISIATPYAMADRYHYLPSIGISIMIAWGIPPMLKRAGVGKNVLFSISIAVLCLLVFSTWMQCGYWKNSITLFNHAVRVTKGNYIAHNNLGVAMSAEGMIKEAIDHYNKAIIIKPNNANAYNNRGNAYSKLGMYDYAIQDYKMAIRIKPDYAEAYNNYAGVFLLQGNTDIGCNYARKSCAMGVCKALKKAENNGSCY